MTRYPHISENENIERVCDARYINDRNFSKGSEFIRNETETVKLRLFFLKKKKKRKASLAIPEILNRIVIVKK